VFAYAQAWREAQAWGTTTTILELAAGVAARNDALNSGKEDK
jgi:hypothetical protein